MAYMHLRTVRSALPLLLAFVWLQGGGLAHGQTLAKPACQKLAPDRVVTLIKERDTPAVLAALKCQRELLADERVRLPLEAAFLPREFPASRPFLEGLRQGGINFLADLAPLPPGDLRANVNTPLGIAMTQVSVEAGNWLLSGARASDLKGYTLLAFDTMTILQGRTLQEERDVASKALLLAAIAKGLPHDAGQPAPHQMALLSWWRTQDHIDYVDNSPDASHRAKPLPAAAAPVWQELVNALEPKDRSAREAARQRAAEAYVKPVVEYIAFKVEQLRQGLATAGREPGAWAEDPSGMVALSSGGSVPRESLTATIAKLRARETRLRSVLSTQMSAMPDWGSAFSPPAAGLGPRRLGRLFGLELGMAVLSADKRSYALPLCTASPVTAPCYSAAAPPHPPLQPILAVALNVRARVQPQLASQSQDRLPPDPMQGRHSGLVQIHPAPQAHGLRLFSPGINAQVRDGRVVAFEFQAHERGLVKELWRLWGDPAEAYTEWYRITPDRIVRRQVGVDLEFDDRGLPDALPIFKEERIEGERQPVTRYRWLSEEVTVELACEAVGLCNVILLSRDTPAAEARVAGVAAAPAPAQGVAREPRVPGEPARTRARIQQIVAQMPKPAQLPAGGGAACDAERPFDGSVPAGAQTSIALLQMRLWALQFIRQGGAAAVCTSGGVLARMWQSAIGVTATGLLSAQDVQAWRDHWSRLEQSLPRSDQ